jgi:nitrate reductase gamma subunit
MDLLDWTRGPLLYAAVVVFVLGVAWRWIALRRWPRSPASGVARAPFSRASALRAALARLWPRAGRPGSATLVTFNPYVFHIGLALVFFGYAPHIAFIRRHTGLHWPALPDAVMYVAAAAAIVSLLMALMFRLTDPVLKKISRADDWITWFVTLLPLVTGMAAIGEPSASILARGAVVYRDALAVHLLSFELLLIWFPFGKLMHALFVLPARMNLATFLGRRGVPS